MASHATPGESEDMSPLSKAVIPEEFVEEPTSMAPDSDSKRALVNETGSKHSKQHRANLGKRLVGRPHMKKSTSSLRSLASQSSLDSGLISDLRAVGEEKEQSRNLESNDDNHQDSHTRLIAQVTAWLHAEKEKRRNKLAKHVHGSKKGDQGQPDAKVPSTTAARTASDRLENATESIEDEDALEQLEKILTGNLVNTNRTPTASAGIERRPSYFQIRRQSSLMKKLRVKSRASTSDTDYYDGDVIVPSCDVVLDNSKTMAFTGGAEEDISSRRAKDHEKQAEKEAWTSFKNEIVRLAHTLRLKGWRRIPLDRGIDIEVERLSGALTNAVYVVSPPKNLPALPTEKSESTTSLTYKKAPPKLLLRIYGPQVEHLIDRDSELQILKRLARKKIGPRMLGTFRNGRFEEFFHAKTLTYNDLRVPETSKQIAKRMRELHDGIDLLEEERDAGPFVWRNWDKWEERSEQVINWVDGKIKNESHGHTSGRPSTWKHRGFLCGVDWSTFKGTVDKYRAWLDDRYGGSSGIRQRLVFAHNDTQYGNLLRMEPTGESPLLLPANEHKQLVVIDFEYASANVPGLEFANHFTEWCYNYHDPEKPYICNTAAYPNLEEQKRFIKAYVQHQPGLRSQTPTSSVGPSATSGTPASSIPAFMLDSRAPPSQITDEDEKRDKAIVDEVDSLLLETKVWRVACSAQWVAWGIVQANLPGLDAELAAKSSESDHLVQQKNEPASGSSTTKDNSASGMVPPQMTEAPTTENSDDKPEEDDEFDYLSYAQERAMFFWGDVIELGIVKPDELPKELLEKIKFVRY